MAQIRTFIAVDIAAEVIAKTQDLVAHLRGSGVRATWTKPENMHLTLKFLGDVDEVRIPDVCRCAAEAGRRHKPFWLRLADAGAFPTLRRPRTVWLGVSEGEHTMCALADEVESLLEAEGFPKEARKYTPHLTLARVRDTGPVTSQLSRCLRDQAGFDAGATRIEQITVYASYLRPEGPTYEVLGAFALGE